VSRTEEEASQLFSRPEWNPPIITTPRAV
jgi:hypothetical protein